MEIGLAAAAVVVLLAVVAFSNRSLVAKRRQKAQIFAELQGQIVTLSINTRVSIGRVRQVAKIRTRVGDIVERDGQPQLTITDTDEVDVGRVLLGKEQFVADQGIALDDILRVVTEDGQEYGWGLGAGSSSDQNDV